MAMPAQTLAGRRIDTHHHFFTPAYVKALDQIGQAPPLVKNWSVAKTLDDMDKAGVGTAVLSMTTPQVGLEKDLPSARRVAREMNEGAAKLASQYPGRFGSFAALPMVDTDAALAELAYALDVLKADGIGMLTSHNDKWLGDPSFKPIMDELNRRKAVLYTHPTSGSCCSNILSYLPPTVVEYGTDTTRTIVDIVFSGTAARCPDMKFIFSHAGGTLPYLTERLQKAPEIDKKLLPRIPNGVMYELQRFYYDTAWTANAYAMSSLTKLVGTPQILLGSDFPYRTGADNVQGLADYGFSAADLQAIERDNAVRLLPNLKTMA
jgi:predicted TIM-barrel fold metal-dependent hydrolase